MPTLRFEDFAVNSLEQLCINITNEQLQYYFNEHIFAAELAEYEREGVVGAAIDYADNKPTLALLIGKGGVLGLLDEESRIPKATDLTFTEKVGALKAHESAALKPSASSRDLNFSVVHYAGAVKYVGRPQPDQFFVLCRHRAAPGVPGALQRARL